MFTLFKSMEVQIEPGVCQFVTIHYVPKKFFFKMRGKILVKKLIVNNKSINM